MPASPSTAQRFGGAVTRDEPATAGPDARARSEPATRPRAPILRLINPLFPADVYFPKRKDTFRRRPFCFVTFVRLEDVQVGAAAF
jgi:hypothetical protein